MRSVLLLTGVHLCRNPRAFKEATTLAGAGLDVEVLGAWFDASLKDQDRKLLDGAPFRFTPVIDLAEAGLRGQAGRLAQRVRSSAGRLVYGAAGLQTRWQLGYAVDALARVAHQRKADLFIAHSETALYVARSLLRSGRRVGVDMEDWFSEDLLPEARTHRPVGLLRDLERVLLNHGAYATCPSNAMSEGLSRAYGCTPPAVVYNAFPWSDRNFIDGCMRDRVDRRIPSIHWYSQMIGRGRGLEDLFAALPYIKHEAEIHLRGMPVAGFDDWLSARLPQAWRRRVFVHDLVSNEELLSRIAEHDIGFAGEMKFSMSRELTITNKILHYLLAGLAVVASDTVGQQEVARQAQGAVLLYPSGNAAALAAQIDKLLASSECLARTKAHSLQAARQTFSWEQQEAVLLRNATSAFGAQASGIDSP